MHTAELPSPSSTTIKHQAIIQRSSTMGTAHVSKIHEWSGAPAWLETHIILVSPSNEYPKRTEAAPKHTLEMRGLPAQSQLLPVVSGTGEYSDKRQRQGIQRWEATTDKQVGGYQLGHQTVCEE